VLSKEGMTLTVLATGLSEAAKKDEDTEKKFDLAEGLVAAPLISNQTYPL